MPPSHAPLCLVIFFVCRAQYGGGMYLAANSLGEFNSLTVDDNFASVSGGGISVVENCTLSTNSVVISSNRYG